MVNRPEAGSDEGYFGPEPTMREQLIEARRRIISELDLLYARSSPGGTTALWRGQPDYRTAYQALQRELHEIDELLGESDAGPGPEDRYSP